jgi:hypothetical protein
MSKLLVGIISVTTIISLLSGSILMIDRFFDPFKTTRLLRVVQLDISCALRL